MADAAADLEEVAHTLFGNEGADLRVVLGVTDGRRRHGMVEGDGHPLRDGDPRLPELPPDLRDRRRVVVAEHDVGTRVDDLADRHALQAAGPGQSLLRERPARVGRPTVPAHPVAPATADASSAVW